jgi:hypothetical protein
MPGQPVDAITMFNRTLGGRPMRQIDGSISALDVLEKGYATAYTFDGSAYVAKIYVLLDDGRNFFRVATPWEFWHSKLCAMPTAVCQPVIDANILVVGHRGTFSGGDIFAKKPLYPMEQGDDDIDSLMDRGFEVMVEGRNHYRAQYVNQGYPTIDSRGGRSMSYDVVTDPEGRVKHVLAKWANEGSAEPSWLQPADLLVIPAVMSALAKGAGRGVMWIIARRAASRAVAAGGAARELTDVLLYAFRRNGSLTAEEMQAHLHEVFANRRELRVLMAGAGLDNEPLARQTIRALNRWEDLYGRSVRFVDNGVVQKLEGARNFASLRPNGELWIEKQVSNDVMELEIHGGAGGVFRERLGEGRWDRYATKARFLFDEVTHELAADALAGRGGILDETVLAHLGPHFTKHGNALFFVESSIERGAVVVVQ